MREAFGEEVELNAAASEKIDEHYGEVDVQVQMFKDIPLQVKLTSGTEEKRFGLPARFLNAMEAAHLKEDNNYILSTKMERHWRPLWRSAATWA